MGRELCDGELCNVDLCNVEPRNGKGAVPWGAVQRGAMQRGAVQGRAVQWNERSAKQTRAMRNRAMGSCAMRNCALWSRAMGKRALGSRATGSSALGKVTCNGELCNRQGFFHQELRGVEPCSVERAVQRGWLRAAGPGLRSGQGGRTARREPCSGEGAVQKGVTGVVTTGVVTTGGVVMTGVVMSRALGAQLPLRPPGGNTPGGGRGSAPLPATAPWSRGRPRGGAAGPPPMPPRAPAPLLLPSPGPRAACAKWRPQAATSRPRHDITRPVLITPGDVVLSEPRCDTPPGMFWGQIAIKRVRGGRRRGERLKCGTSGLRRSVSAGARSLPDRSPGARGRSLQVRPRRGCGGTGGTAQYSPVQPSMARPRSAAQGPGLVGACRRGRTGTAREALPVAGR